MIENKRHTYTGSTSTIQDNANNNTNNSYDDNNNKSLEIHNTNLDSINITTHNVQGLNCRLKFQRWMEHYYDNHYHIISMTETKWAQSTYTNLMTANQYYKIFTA